MNVLKPDLQATIKTLLSKGLSQREIERKTGIDRKTIRRYAHLMASQKGEPAKSSIAPEVATGSLDGARQNPPPWPPVQEPELPGQARSACEEHREWIEQQVRLGRNGMAIYQDLVELFGFTHCYNSVKRFVRGLKSLDPRQYDRLEFLMGEEAQVDYGQGAPTLHQNGKYLRPRLFIMTLKYSGRAFRKTVWKSGQETWCKLHEEAFRYFGGCPQYVTLDNLREGVIKPDIYEPELNPLYAAMLAHYGVVADPARVRDSNRKGTVENAVKHAQNTALKGRRFDSIEAQNDWLRHWESRWASQRIHGRSKRQVEVMFQEEKPFLAALPLMPFRYFEQEKRTVYDDGTIQVGRSYYAAGPAPIGRAVTVRIFDNEIQILDPRRMEVIRRHPKSKRAGSLMMEPGDRIFNPSRETDRLLSQAEAIGPHTFSLCEKWFREEGRCGQRRMYGLVNLVRHYPACYIEKAARLAQDNGLKSSKALRRMVESLAAEAQDRQATPAEELTQDHPLIRPGEDYAAFWARHAAQAPSPAGPVPGKVSSSQSPVISREAFSQIWQQASWLKVIEVFGLVVDDQRRSRDDEIWVISPFTAESRASLHLSLSANVYKDFSSGQGGGIMQFCREMWRRQGRELSMFEVAQWMLAAGISVAHTDAKRQIRQAGPPAASQVNRAIEVDLRPFLRSDHPEWERRGISAQTCRYLGCGFLPPRPGANGTSPLNARLVFQIRGLRETAAGVQPIILSHSGRALSPEQADRAGKYWSYPFRKSLEIYNQDNLLLDEEARRQAHAFGLVLVEGFFDVAKLVEAGCRNVGAVMGAQIAAGQIDRLVWLRSRIGFPRLVLFLDRDQAGRDGARQAAQRLRPHDFEVSVFDLDLMLSWNDHAPGPLPHAIADPADMSVAQLCSLRTQGII